MTMPKIKAIKLLHKMSVNTIRGGKTLAFISKFGPLHHD